MIAAAPVPPVPARKSMRARAWFATLAMLAYLALWVAWSTVERGKIYDSIEALEANSRHAKALVQVEAAVAAALSEVNEAIGTADPALRRPELLHEPMERCARLFVALEPFDPSYSLLERALGRGHAALVAAPEPARWTDLRDTMLRVADELEIRQRRVADARDELTTSYRRQYDAVTVETFGFATVGVVGFGTLAAWFFTRLARDVRRLELHAHQIVHGTRGVALPVTREDELGRLMHAVNRMAVDLDEREKQIELNGQRRSHMEKMLAVGALAAGVAHEVNNPLAVISGVAQELSGADGAPPPPQERVTESAQIILAQTQRAAQVARQLAEVAAPQPSELDWTDINALVRRVVQLMGYDRRYRSFAFEVDADPALPAVRTSGNAVQQVLMQMLALGCDAMATARDAPLRVRAATAVAPDGGAEVELQFAPALDFGRSEVQRSLLLARASIEPLGGRLAFGAPDEPRLRIRLALPADAAGGAGLS